jgi:hypothetical protein
VIFYCIKIFYYDKAGEVHGCPSQVEVDVLIKNSAHVLVEVKASPFGMSQRCGENEDYTRGVQE